LVGHLSFVPRLTTPCTTLCFWCLSS